jgi:two-component system alkaline phosphatase synthesis response regulator PhoP
MILSVDDEPSVLALRQFILERAGYQVLSAPDGTHALDMFRSNSVELVLLDYCMPGMSGAEVAAEIKRLRPGVPVMLVTASLPLPSRALDSVDCFMDKAQGPEAMLLQMSKLLSQPATAARPAAA